MTTPPNEPSDNRPSHPLSASQDSVSPEQSEQATPSDIPVKQEGAVYDDDKVNFVDADAEKMPAELLQERVDRCTLANCQGGIDDDFYLRDIRNNRPLCQFCAVSTPVGYIGKDTAKASEDKFYNGTDNDDLITGSILFGGALVLTTVVMLFLINFRIPFIGWLVSYLAGMYGGQYIIQYARQRTGRRIGRNTPNIAMACIALGTFVAPVIVVLFQFGIFLFDFSIMIQLLFIERLICGGAFAYTAWRIYNRRI